MSVILTPAGLQIQTVTTATPGAGNAATFPVDSAPSLTLLIAGTFSATLTFEGSIDGQTWAALSALKLADGTVVATTTGTGLFAFTNLGVALVRARCSTYTSGAASISASRGVVSGMTDVAGPISAIDGHLAVFNGTTGRVLKDGGARVTVPGADTQVLFNDGEALGANAGLTFDKTTKLLTVQGVANPTTTQGQAAVHAFIDAPTHSGSGTLFGVNAFTSLEAGNISELQGLRADGNYVAAGATVSRSYGAYLAANVNDGTLTDNYGLFIEDQAGIGAAGNWAINTGTGLVEFGDRAIVHGTVTASDFIVSGSAFKPDTTDGHQAKWQVYDVDDATYRDVLVLTNGNAPAVVLGPPTGGTLEVKASVFKSSDGSTGATASIVIPAVATITVKNGLIVGVA